MSEKVNCPFCGNLIEEDAYKCPNCDAVFKTPELPYIRFQDFRIFLALDVMTFGFFTVIWFFVNVRLINKLCEKNRDRIKLNWLVLLLLMVVCSYMFYLFKFKAGYLLSILVFASILLLIALTHRVIRIIQKYTLKTYGVELEYNPYYIAIFNVLYLIHFIDTYQDRVNQVHSYFNIKSPQMILLIILLLITQFMACLDPNIHNLYKWLFGF